MHERQIAEFLNSLAELCHKRNVKWWTDPVTREPLENRNRAEMMMLMVSEIAEAMEAYRKSLRDDKLPHLDGEVVELADLLIRLLDYVGKFYPTLFGQAFIEKMAYNKTRQDHTFEARSAPGGKKF